MPQSDPLDSPEFPALYAEEDLYDLDAGQPIIATLAMRADPQNLPEGITKKWRGTGFAGFGRDDFGNAFSERGEICDFIERHGITGFAVVSGDRHSFWAGLLAKALPPKEFKPVGLAFVTGSLSAPGMVEAYEHKFPKDHPLRALYVPGVNMLLKHGVRSGLEYAHSGDAARARELSNPDLAPHVSFVDMGGHGYAVVRAAPDYGREKCHSHGVAAAEFLWRVARNALSFDLLHTEPWGQVALAEPSNVRLVASNGAYRAA